MNAENLRYPTILNAVDLKLEHFKRTDLFLISLNENIPKAFYRC